MDAGVRSPKIKRMNGPVFGVRLQPDARIQAGRQRMPASGRGP
jgi:hypothetical protein